MARVFDVSLGHGEGAGADMLKFIVGLMIGMTLGLYLATYGRELAEVLGLSALVTLL